MAPTDDPPPARPTPSAYDQAALIGLEAEAVERHIRRLTHLLTELRQEQRAWRAGGRGENRVVRVLVDLDDVGWRVLSDRQWPGTRTANIDVIVVGPAGVFVVDAKNWSREVRVEGGRLWRGDYDATEEIEKLLGQTTAVEDVVSDTGLPPAEVTPLLVLVGRKGVMVQLERVLILGEHDLVPELVRRGARLPAALVEQLVVELDRGCPPMPQLPRRSARHARTHTDLDTPLMDTRRLWQALEQAASLEPIESWMTWLHPLQAKQVSRTFNGPARIRGGAGTGKTVLALHRAKYLAAHGRRVLFTSYLKTLPPVSQALFARLAPAQRHLVQFASVHAFAKRTLDEYGVDLRIDPDAADNLFNRAWASTRRDSVLSDLTGAELYNLADDIGESKNLAAARPEKAKELGDRWQQWNKQLMKPRWSAPPSGGRGGSH